MSKLQLGGGGGKTKESFEQRLIPQLENKNQKSER